MITHYSVLFRGDSMRLMARANVEKADLSQQLADRHRLAERLDHTRVITTFPPPPSQH
jgi:hypothetical protein